MPGLDPKTTVKVEGALMPLKGSTPPVVWSDPAAADFELALKDIVNQPGLNQVIAPYADPLVAPPIYGRWYAGRATVTPGAANWLDSLNLDPRWRSAAALGTEVIQQHQEALMASAWEQAAEIQPVNQRLRQLQMSMAVGESLHARHLFPLSEDMTLRFASPAFGRLRMPDSRPRPGRTHVTAMMAGTSLPVPATRTAMRRIGRQRGPLSRRIAAKGVRPVDRRDLGGLLNLGIVSSAPAPPRSCRPPFRRCRPWKRSSAPAGTPAFRSPPRTSRCLHCQPSIRCRRAGTIRGTSARRPRIICRALRPRISASLIPHIR